MARVDTAGTPGIAPSATSAETTTAATTVFAQPRIEWIDAAKGVAILLVVFGHVVAQPYGNTVSLLRMPFFFFVAGYVFKPRPLTDFLWKRGNSLLIPYAAYTAIIAAMFVILAAAGVENHYLFNNWQFIYLKQLIKGGHYVSAQFYFGPLWFLSALFATLLLLNTILNRFGSVTSIATIVSIGLCVGAGYALAGVHTFHAIGVAPIAVFFVWAGAVYRRIEVPAWMVFPAIVMLAIAYLTTTGFSFWAARYGIPVVSLLGALAACYLAALACAWLARFDWFNQTLSPLGQNSLVILALHQSVALRLKHGFDLPGLTILPIAVGVPLLIAFALRRTGWVSQWLFLGIPPEHLRTPSIAAPTLARPRG